MASDQDGDSVRIEPHWQESAGPESISESQVHLWRIDVRKPPRRTELLMRLLSETERRRHDAFRLRSERDAYCISHGYLRILLGRYGCGRPDEIRMTLGKYGKPRLDPAMPHPGIAFNLSHSGSCVVIAMAREREVGVDVQEVLVSTPIEEISRRFFSPEEDASIRLQPERMLAAAFYACWTRKEAAIKALGGSIAWLAGDVVVSTDPQEPPRLLRLPAGEDARAWTLQDLHFGQGYSGALCYGGPAASVHLWEPDHR